MLSSTAIAPPDLAPPLDADPLAMPVWCELLDAKTAAQLLAGADGTIVVHNKDVVLPPVAIRALERIHGATSRYAVADMDSLIRKIGMRLAMAEQALAAHGLSLAVGELERSAWPHGAERTYAVLTVERKGRTSVTVQVSR